MIIDLIAGARPNFIKIAPLVRAIQKHIDKGADIKYRLVHTGQHYDNNMSSKFFRELNIPDPYVNFGAGGGTQATQTASIMIAYEDFLQKEKCDLCIVVGDVTSTMACTIVAKKLKIKVAHVEAGIRSHDMTMPEEINRMVTDSISDFFFTTSELASNNLMKNGVNPAKIHFVGNVMIDTLNHFTDKFKKTQIWEELELKEKEYMLLTLHRPSNVDDANKFKLVLEEICNNSRDIPIVFPVHPRTLKTLKELKVAHKNLHLTEPMGYLEFNYLTKNAKVVITDSGGITEETTVMSVPCITFRDSIERPETVTIGTNELIGTDISAIKPTLDKLFEGNWKKGNIPDMWDGKTSERIIDILLNDFS